MKSVIVVIASGSIAQAIARRVGVGKHILLADIKLENAQVAAKILCEAGFEVNTVQVNVAERLSVRNLVVEASKIGEIVGVIHTAGLSPSQAKPQDILKVDLYGTAVVFDEFGKVIAKGGSGVVIGSQSSHRLNIDELTQIQADLLATLPAEDLLVLPWIQEINDSLRAY